MEKARLWVVLMLVKQGDGCSISQNKARVEWYWKGEKVIRITELEYISYGPILFEYQEFSKWPVIFPMPNTKEEFKQVLKLTGVI